PAAEGPGVSRGWRLLDRRHRHLSLAALMEAAGPEHRRLSEPEALVRGDRCAACGAARSSGPGGPATVWSDGREGARGSVRRDAVSAALGLRLSVCAGGGHGGEGRQATTGD